jgi:type III secretion protein C
MSPQSMLDLLSATYSMIWYYDGNVLFVSPSSDADTAVLRASRASIDDLRSTINRLGIADPKYPITYDLSKDVAIVSGPKRYIELVRQTLQAVEAGDTSKSNSSVEVIRLKYAWAGDHDFSQNGHSYRIPGVATVLQKLHSGGSGRTGTDQATSSFGGSSSEGLTSMQKLRSMGLIPNKEGKYGPPDIGALFAGTANPASSNEGKTSTGPRFEAENRLNAVIVRDHPSRMSYHRAVIESLDVKPALVEIEARIIEVSSDDFHSLGVDWRFRSNKVDAQLGNSTLPVMSREDFLGPRGGTALGPDLRGGVLTALTGDAARYLMARVKALSEDGKANILSSPKVTTLDNVEAVIENLSTFFVRVSGNLDASLFDVSAGTSLRVTPLVVQDADGTQIKMAVRIEDGRISTAMVDKIPVVNRSTISSETFVKSGNSLLIAGYATESSSHDQAGLPGLSKIPVLGHLFGTTETRKTRVERLFMLTPRLVVPQ